MCLKSVQNILWIPKSTIWLILQSSHQAYSKTVDYNFQCLDALYRNCLDIHTEFSEMRNQAYFYANFLFCMRTFPAGDSNLHHFFFC